MSEYATMKQANRLFGDVKKLQEQMETVFKLLGNYAHEPKEVAQTPFQKLNQQTQLFAQPAIIKAIPYIPETKPTHWATDTVAMRAKRIQLLHTEIGMVNICYPNSVVQCDFYKELKSGLVYHTSELLLVGQTADYILKEQAETKKLLVKGILKL